MNTRVGDRVAAFESMDSGTARLYGYGVYVGDLPRPGTDPDVVSAEDREMYTRVIESISIEREVEFYASWCETLIASGEMTRDEVEAAVADRRSYAAIEDARPMEERVMALHRHAILNPKIVLDSGAAVWGFQCWWCNEDAGRSKIGSREVVIVPVPEGN